MLLRLYPNWKRAGLLALLLGIGLTLVAATRADDKKLDDKAKVEAKAKADDKPEPKGDEKPEPKEVTVPPPSGGHPATDTINKELAKFWAANSVKPAAKATDYEFCRRVYLDIIGRVPAAWEVKAYISDTDVKGKRAKLITKLMNDPYYKEDYANNWADIWTTLLITRAANRTYRDQMNDWLAEEFSKNRPWDQMVRSLLTAVGSTDGADGGTGADGKEKRDDAGAVNFILAHLGDNQQKRDEEGQFDMVPITSRSVRLFLGVQIQCTQCHDHPFNNEWKQSHFWGVNAFFRQIERDGQPNMQANNRNAMAAQLKLKDNRGYNTTNLVYFEDRQAVVKASPPKFLDGKPLPANGKKTRREVVSDYFVDHDLFSKAAVNRLWGHFFGRGLCAEPKVDDFGEHNQVVHPEMLESVSKKFKEYKYDFKELISWICNSEAYALSCTANKTNEKTEHEPYFSRMLLKNMTPEQLFDSLRTALDQPEAIKKPRPGVTKKPGSTRTIDEGRKRAREEWLGRLTRNFGDDEGNEITFNGTVVQALLLMNGREMQTELTRKDNNTVINAISKGKGVRGTLDELTLASLGRRATEKEVNVVNSEIKKTGANALWFWEDVFWALLNSNEFILNH